MMADMVIRWDEKIKSTQTTVSGPVSTRAAKVVCLSAKTQENSPPLLFGLSVCGVVGFLFCLFSLFTADKMLYSWSWRRPPPTTMPHLSWWFKVVIFFRSTFIIPLEAIMAELGVWERPDTQWDQGFNSFHMTLHTACSHTLNSMWWPFLSSWKRVITILFFFLIPGWNLSSKMLI